MAFCDSSPSWLTLALSWLGIYGTKQTNTNTNNIYIKKETQFDPTNYRTLGPSKVDSKYGSIPWGRLLVIGQTTGLGNLIKNKEEEKLAQESLEDKERPWNRSSCFSVDYFFFFFLGRNILFWLWACCMTEKQWLGELSVCC